MVAWFAYVEVLVREVGMIRAVLGSGSYYVLIGSAGRLTSFLYVHDVPRHRHESRVVVRGWLLRAGRRGRLIDLAGGGDSNVASRQWTGG